MKGSRHLAACVAALALHPAMAADSLCTVVGRLAAAPPEKTGSPAERRWIEFHWGFDHSPDSLWSWGCRHSGDRIAKQTCEWLQNHTNQEFTMLLPQNIMRCYGYSLPRHAAYNWAKLAGTIALHGGSERRLLLDLNYRDLPKGEVAMRLAVEADGIEYEPDELPPIGPMPIEKAN